MRRSFVLLLLVLLGLPSAWANSLQPQIDSLAPDKQAAGPVAAGGLPLVVYGSNFLPLSKVYFNGRPVTTSYVNDQELSATLPAAALGCPGSVPVTVTNILEFSPLIVSNTRQFMVENNFSASDDAVSTSLGAPLLIDVLANDSAGPEADPAVCSNAPDRVYVYGYSPLPAEQGMIVPLGQRNGLFEYIPSGSFSGATSFSYWVKDDYGAQAIRTVKIDVGAHVNTAPTITAIANQSILEDQLSPALSFSIGDLETPIADLKLIATSSDLELVPVEQISFAGTEALRSVTIRPAANRFGRATITLIVQDAAGAMAKTSFELHVAPVNDPPSFTAIANQSILEDQLSPALSFSIGDLETPLADLRLLATSSDPGLVPVEQILFTGTEALRSVTIRPAANRFGRATITLIVQDAAGAMAKTSFELHVAPVNDPPSFQRGTDVVVDEDVGLFEQPSWATQISPGTNELSQTLRFDVLSNSRPDLFAVQPAVSFTGTLSFTPVAEVSGSAVVTLVLHDDHPAKRLETSTQQTFSITIRPVNDPPTAVDDVATVYPNSMGNRIPVLLNDLFTPDADERLRLYAVSGAQQGQVQLSLAGDALMYTPRPGFRGVESLSYTVCDRDPADQPLCDSGLVTVTVLQRWQTYVPMMRSQR